VVGKDQRTEREPGWDGGPDEEEGEEAGECGEGGEAFGTTGANDVEGASGGGGLACVWMKAVGQAGAS
jgi:hypothetical protein